MARAAVSEGESLLLGGSLAPRAAAGGGGGGGGTPASSAPPPQRIKMYPHCEKRGRKTMPSCNQALAPKRRDMMD